MAGCATAGLDASGRQQLRRLGGLVAVAVALLPAVAIIGSIPGYGRQRRRSRSLGLLCRAVLRALHVTVETRGMPRSGACLVVANHTSWLDVLALNAAAPMIPLAKTEVADWPVIGALARRGGALFIERARLRDLPRTVAEMAAELRRGHRVQVFPEGTTRCGRAVGRFHRAAFQAAIDAAVVVQPAVLRYRDGSAATTAAAFVGDENLIASLSRVLRMRQPVVELRWLAPIPAIAGTGRDAVDRARVATLCENAIARALGQPVVGKPASRSISGQRQMVTGGR